MIDDETSTDRTSVTSNPVMNPVELQQGLVEAGRILRGFYEGLEGRRVRPARPLREIALGLEGSLGEEGVGLAAALADVEERLLPDTMAVPHPLYLGLINSSPMAGGVVAESIIGGLNNNSGSWEQAPSFVAAEQEVVRTFAGLLGLARDTSGILLPGGSYAALHALQLARDARLPAWRRDGLRALSGNPRVYVSDASHFSAARAALAIGVAERDIVRVPTLGRGRMDPDALAALLREDKTNGALPFALVATLGTTGTGAMDSLPRLVELCREHGLWLHVDACYGGAGALLEEVVDRFEGIEQADSVAVDPHKWFFVPMVAGLLFTRHADLELQVYDIDAPYIPTGDLIDPFRRAIPTSRRCAGFAVWLALRAHGLGAVRKAVRRTVELARRLEQELAKQGFQVMEGGELSIACARWQPAGVSRERCDAMQREIAAASVDSGEAWFGTVPAQGKTWLRFSLVSTFTRVEHIDRLARSLGEIARSVPG